MTETVLIIEAIRERLKNLDEILVNDEAIETEEYIQLCLPLHLALLELIKGAEVAPEDIPDVPNLSGYPFSVPR